MTSDVKLTEYVGPNTSLIGNSGQALQQYTTATSLNHEIHENEIFIIFFFTLNTFLIPFLNQSLLCSAGVSHGSI